MPLLTVAGVIRPQLFVIAALLFTWTPVQAQEDPKFATIARLGELNGVALHCKALAETQRMKRALVANLPKRRQLGELFDLETHNSFMRFMQENDSCPSAAELQQQVDVAISELEKVYQNVKPD